MFDVGLNIACYIVENCTSNIRDITVIGMWMDIACTVEVCFVSRLGVNVTNDVLSMRVLTLRGRLNRVSFTAWTILLLTTCDWSVFQLPIKERIEAGKTNYDSTVQPRHNATIACIEMSRITSSPHIAVLITVEKDRCLQMLFTTAKKSGNGSSGM